MYNRLYSSRTPYYYLFATVIASICGAFLGFQNPRILIWLNSWLGWIIFLFIINMIPRIVLKYRYKPMMGFLLLLIKGCSCGIILSPAILISQRVKCQIGIAEIALIISALIFILLTVFVKLSSRSYQVDQKLMSMISISLFGAVFLNLVMPSGLLGLAISIGIGIFGILILVNATAGIVNYQATPDPILWAVILFSAIFGIFTAVIYLLLTSLL